MADRPRFAQLVSLDGAQRAIPIQGEGDEFTAIDPLTDRMLDMDGNDRILFDDLPVGQKVTLAIDGRITHLRTGGNHPVYHRPAQPRTTKGAAVTDKPKDPNGWWKGLVALAALTGIIVLGIRGVVWALG